MTAFSYTFLDTFHNVCPKQAHHKFILRDVKTTYTQQGGIDKHKALEDRFRYDKPLPPELAKAEPVAVSLKRPGLKLSVEVELSVKGNHMPCDYYSTEVRWRSKPDVLAYPHTENATALLFDFKTGKPRENELQHAINASLIFSSYPRINVILGRNFYTKSGELGPVYTYDRTALPTYWARIERLAEEIEAEKIWPARPGPLCAWCPVMSCPNNRSRERA